MGGIVSVLFSSFGGLVKIFKMLVKFWILCIKIDVLLPNFVLFLCVYLLIGFIFPILILVIGVVRLLSLEDLRTCLMLDTR